MLTTEETVEHAPEDYSDLTDAYGLGYLDAPTFRRLAVAAHGKQVDKLGDPYVMHLDGVAANVRALGGDEELAAAAYGHDVIEDVATVTVATVRAWGASERQVAAIVAVTKPSGAVQSEYLETVVVAGRDAQTLKLADLMHNMRPDRRARLKTDGERNRLLRKYAPSIARLMKELGYLLTDEELAAVPQGSYSYATTGTTWTSVFEPHTATWLQVGDEVRVEEDGVQVVRRVASKEKSVPVGQASQFVLTGDVPLEVPPGGKVTSRLANKTAAMTVFATRPVEWLQVGDELSLTSVEGKSETYVVTEVRDGGTSLTVEGGWPVNPSAGTYLVARRPSGTGGT